MYNEECDILGYCNVPCLMLNIVIVKTHMNLKVFNSLPNDKSLDYSKFWALADFKINETGKI